MSRAMPKAVAAAIPPISDVCNALRIGPAPVKWPFTYPKMTSAIKVTLTEVVSAVWLLDEKK